MDIRESSLSSFFHFVLILFIFSAIISCVDFDRLDAVDISHVDGEFAIPIFDTEIQIIDGLEIANTDATTSISPEGNITFYYNGELLEQTSQQIFPPIPAEEFIIPDTSGTLDVPFPVPFISTKTIFKNNFAFFTFQSQFSEPVDVTITFPQLSKDGDLFTESYRLSPLERFTSPLIPLTGWILNGDINKLDVSYDARTSSGERVKLEFVSFKVDFLNFSYVEGFLDKTEFDFELDSLPIGIFDTWISGDIEFEDPRVVLFIDNSFGFPVRAIPELLVIETIDDEVLQLESSYIQTGIDIDYSRLIDVGKITTTEFAFDNTNSNIDELFGKKVKQLKYDMLALAFPDGFGTLGYLTDSSFFKIRVALELPSKFKVNDLILGDTIAINLDTLDEVRSLEYKLLAVNSYPIDIQAQGYFLDSNGGIIDSISHDDWIHLPAALPPGNTNSLDTTVVITRFEEDALDKVRKAESLLFSTRFNSPSSISEPIWLTEEYSLILKMGAKGVYENE